MIRHLLKMVWNRKRANALLALEIAISFLVLFAVVSLAVYSWDNYSRPLGYSSENVWNVHIDRQITTDDEWTPRMVETTRHLFLAVRELPEVEAVAAMMAPPYSNARISGNYTAGGRTFSFDANEATDGLPGVMKLSIVSGRWFSKEDDGAGYLPVVINQELARFLFGTEDPAGKSLVPAAEGAREERIVGVITDFRKGGEYSGTGNYLFRRANLDDPGVRPPGYLVVRVRPGTRKDFEEKLSAKLGAVAKDWSFEIKPLAEIRAGALKLRLAPLLAVGLVATFLMIMVALGLTGVLWQNVTQRTKEIGVRRAKGATGGDIYIQILGELFVLTSVGVALGTAVAMQFPLLGLLGSVSPRVHIASFVISLVALYALTTLCGLYPSWLATRVRPAEALHYE